MVISCDLLNRWARNLSKPRYLEVTPVIPSLRSKQALSEANQILRFTQDDRHVLIHPVTDDSNERTRSFVSLRMTSGRSAGMISEGSEG
jgi:hypothetical protein